MDKKPLVSFCISTYKRPEILNRQIELLLQQIYSDFFIVISDNDPGKSAEQVANGFCDERIKYFPNGENLGILKSFNKSIERSVTEFIVMITDDDPLDIHFLSEMMPLINDYPKKSLYGGFRVKFIKSSKVAAISKNDFPSFVLDPAKNPFIFWSNCILRKVDVLEMGCIPEYEGTHLADHALLAICGSINGAVIKNKIYSSHTQHENNYSKTNFSNYYSGCIGFYNFLNEYFKNKENSKKIKKVIRIHLKNWFISMSFTLRRYFYKTANKKALKEIDEFSNDILNLDFMRGALIKYKIKKIIFRTKAFFNLL